MNPFSHLVVGVKCHAQQIRYKKEVYQKHVNNCSADCLESPIYVLVDAEGLNDFEAQKLHTQSIKIHVQSLPLRKLHKVHLAWVCNNVLHFA